LVHFTGRNHTGVDDSTASKHQMVLGHRYFHVRCPTEDDDGTKIDKLANFVARTFPGLVNAAILEACDPAAFCAVVERHKVHMNDSKSRTVDWSGPATVDRNWLASFNSSFVHAFAAFWADKIYPPALPSL
jgi:hypothetical protein